MRVVSIADHSHMCRHFPEATIMIDLTNLFPINGSLCMCTRTCTPNDARSRGPAIGHHDRGVLSLTRGAAKPVAETRAPFRSS